jgi:hypothetical protein
MQKRSNQLASRGKPQQCIRLDRAYGPDTCERLANDPARRLDASLWSAESEICFRSSANNGRQMENTINSRIE